MGDGAAKAKQAVDEDRVTSTFIRTPTRTPMPLVMLNVMIRDRDCVAGFLVTTDACAFESMNMQDFIDSNAQYMHISADECRQCTSSCGDVSLHVRKFT